MIRWSGWCDEPNLMSRAFVREGDGAPDPLPDLPVSSHRNHITPCGLAALLSRRQVRQSDLTARAPAR